MKVAKLQEIPGGKMKHMEMKQNNNLNAKKNNNRYVITSATIFTLAIIAAASSTLVATPTAATTTTTSNATTSASGLELSPQPVWEEVVTTTGVTPINQTHISVTYTENDTLSLPNNNQTINITSTGSLIASIMDSTAVGEEVITTEDGTESATQKFFIIARFNMEDNTARAIVIALVHTNSTGRLAPLNGMILVGTHEGDPTQTATFRYWEWQSGIPLPPAATIMEEPSPLMDDTTTTTTTTNATTTTDAADTNAATTAAPEEEVGAEGDEQQQPQQTTPTIPPPNPLFE